jgi:hypothetical protein
MTGALSRPQRSEEVLRITDKYLQHITYALLEPLHCTVTKLAFSVLSGILMSKLLATTRTSINNGFNQISHEIVFSVRSAVGTLQSFTHTAAQMLLG